jgi:hypothetical protein
MEVHQEEQRNRWLANRFTHSCMFEYASCLEPQTFLGRHGRRGELCSKSLMLCNDKVLGQMSDQIAEQHSTPMRFWQDEDSSNSACFADAVIVMGADDLTVRIQPNVLAIIESHGWLEKDQLAQPGTQYIDATCSKISDSDVKSRLARWYMLQQPVQRG